MPFLYWIGAQECQLFPNVLGWIGIVAKYFYIDLHYGVGGVTTWTGKLLVHNNDIIDSMPLRWRHNGHDGVSNHQPYDCLFNRLFRRRSKKTSKLCVTGLCVGNSPGTGEFPAQMASNAENVSIWWRHHAYSRLPQGNHLSKSSTWPVYRLSYVK